MSRAEINQLCGRWGLDPLLVQAAGGNVSWKDADTLWIKGSGLWLADAERRDIFVGVDLPSLRSALSGGDFNVKPGSLREDDLRPSIETVLHALMPHRLVVHLHPVDVIARLVRVDGGNALTATLAAGLRCIEVGYHKPGAPLAQAIHEALSSAGGADVLLLRNHGVVIGGEDASRITQVLEALTAALTCPVTAPRTQIPAPVQGCTLVPVADPDLHALATDSGLLARVISDWALYPDHVVFLAAHPLVLDDWHALTVLGATPELVFMRGAGVYTDPQFSIAKLAQLRCYFDVLVRQPAGAQLMCLTERQIGELLNWDAEHYRQSLPTVRR